MYIILVGVIVACLILKVKQLYHENKVEKGRSLDFEKQKAKL
jgi:hypothetical protein